MLNILHTALTLVGIGLIIFVHELGHFLAARAVGIRVEAFSIGFGPRLVGFRRGTTDWKICLIPLGGFVKMAGETPSAPRTGASDEFASKTVAQRTLVISAGVIMNIIFALVSLPIAFAIGVPFEVPEIGSVTQGDAAWEAGLHAGDRVLSVDDRTLFSSEDLLTAIAIGGDHVRLAVQRDGRTFTVEVPTKRDSVRGFQGIGLLAQSEPLKVTEELVTPEKAPKGGEAAAAHRAAAGLRAGDVILSVDGMSCAEFRSDHTEFVPRLLRVRRGTDELDVTLQPLDMSAEEIGDLKGLFGIGPDLTVTRLVKDSPAAQLGIAAGDRIETVGTSPVRSVRDLILAVARPRPERGIGIVKAGGESQRLDADLTDENLRASLRRDLMFRSTRVIPEPASAAAAAGVQPGDVVESVDGKPVKQFDEIKAANAGVDTATFTIVRGRTPIAAGETVQIRITRAAPRRNQAFRDFGYSQPLYTKRVPPSQAISAGFDYTTMMTARVLNTLRGLFARRVSADKLGGIITIVRQSVDSSKIAFSRGLLFLAVISINLAVLNILPIPVLDGGWLLFLLLERIKGKPVSDGVVNVFSWIGFILILGLMLFVTWNDIRHWIAS